MLGRHALAVLGDLDRHARSLAAKPVSASCAPAVGGARGVLGRAAASAGRSVHVWQAGSAGEQLLAAHSVSTSCWRCWGGY